jgi:hypothetical protein
MEGFYDLFAVSNTRGFRSAFSTPGNLGCSPSGGGSEDIEIAEDSWEGPMAAWEAAPLIAWAQRYDPRTPRSSLIFRAGEDLHRFCLESTRPFYFLRLGYHARFLTLSGRNTG